MSLCWHWHRPLWLNRRKLKIAERTARGIWDAIRQLSFDILEDFWLRVDYWVFEVSVDENFVSEARVLLSLPNFEVEPVDADVGRIVAVVPVAANRVADVEPVAVGRQENGGNTVTVNAIPKIVISISMVDLG